MDPLTTASPPRQVKIDGTGFEDLISNLGLQDESPFLKMITNIKYYERCPIYLLISSCLIQCMFTTVHVHFFAKLGVPASSDPTLSV